MKTFRIDKAPDGSYVVTKLTAQFASIPVSFKTWELLVEAFSTVGATKSDLEKAKQGTLTIEDAVMEKWREEFTGRWQELKDKYEEAASSPSKKTFVPGPKYDATAQGGEMSTDEIEAEISRVQAKLDCFKRWS